MSRLGILASLYLFGAFLIVVGLTLATGGIYLVSLGGSAYYFVFGLLLMVSGFLVLRGRMSGAWVYLAALSLALGWALWEVGLDVWPLLPRLDGPIALGLVFFTPWIRRGLSHSTSLAKAQFSGGFARGLLQNGAAIVIAAAGVGAMMASPPHQRLIKPATTSISSE
jgi:glucose dehydrogenase